MTEREQKLFAFAQGELPPEEMQAMQLTLTDEERIIVEDMRNMDAMISKTLRRESMAGLNEEEIAGLHQKIDALAKPSAKTSSSLWTKLGFGVPILAAAAAVALYVMPATEQLQKIAQESAMPVGEPSNEKSEAKMQPPSSEPAKDMADRVTIAQTKPQKRADKRSLQQRPQERRGGNIAAAPKPNPAGQPPTKRWESKADSVKGGDTLALRQGGPAPASPPSAAPAGAAGSRTGFGSGSGLTDTTSAESATYDGLTVGGADQTPKKKAKAARPSQVSRSAQTTQIKFIAVTTTAMVVNRVERALDGKRNAFARCPYNDDELIMVTSDVTEAGVPTNIKVEDTSAATATCIEQIVQTMRFPERKGQRQFTFGLSPQ